MTREEFDMISWDGIKEYLKTKDPLIARNQWGDLLIFTVNVSLSFPGLKKDGIGGVNRYYYPNPSDLKFELQLFKTYPYNYVEGTKPRFT